MIAASCNVMVYQTKAPSIMICVSDITIMPIQEATRTLSLACYTLLRVAIMLDLHGGWGTMTFKNKRTHSTKHRTWILKSLLAGTNAVDFFLLCNCMVGVIGGPKPV